MVSDSILSKLDLPEEIGVNEAAMILNVSRRTVIRYIEDGVLIARDAAPLRSKHKSYRLPLKAVIEMRTDYTIQQRPKPAATQQTLTGRYEPTTMKRKGPATPGGRD
jgi:hypothetical protein